MTCGVYVIWSRDRRTVYVGESSNCETRDTYRLAKLLGWPARVAERMPQESSKKERLAMEAVVARRLVAQGYMVYSNNIKRRGAEGLQPLQVLTLTELAKTLDLPAAKVKKLGIPTVGVRNRYMVRDLLDWLASKPPHFLQELFGTPVIIPNPPGRDRGGLRSA